VIDRLLADDDRLHELCGLLGEDVAIAEDPQLPITTPDIRRKEATAAQRVAASADAKPTQSKRK